MRFGGGLRGSGVRGLGLRASECRGLGLNRLMSSFLPVSKCVVSFRTLRTLQRCTVHVVKFVFSGNLHCENLSCPTRREKARRIGPKQVGSRYQHPQCKDLLRASYITCLCQNVHALEA